MIELTEKEKIAKERVCLALDVPTVQDSLKLAEELSDLVGMFKVGKELHTSAGNEGINIVNEIYKRGGSVFLDLKLHDTPQTVYRAAKACTVPGVKMFNVHISGGEKMCKEAIRGAYEEATSAKNQGKHIAPYIIGVTELTSLDDHDLEMQGLGIKYDDLVARRSGLAVLWGLNGIVCPASKAGSLERELGDRLMYVTPGIEWGGKKGDGQKQVYTPDFAVRDCKNSILVIGSAITKADDKRGTAYEILKIMAKEL
jgi:orotidine-5'-phosphate decarboxylase